MLLLQLWLLAAAVTAKPVHRTPKRQYANTTFLSGITQTLAEVEGTTPTCTASYISREEECCGELAATHGIQLYDEEASERSDSARCDRLLRGYGICCSNPTTTPLPTPSDFSQANATITNGTAILNTATPLNVTNNIEQRVGTRWETITELETQTLWHTLGHGGLASVRTIVFTHTNVAVITYTTSVAVWWPPHSGGPWTSWITTDSPVTTGVSSSIESAATTSTSLAVSPTPTISTISPSSTSETSSTSASPTSTSVPTTSTSSLIPTSSSIASTSSSTPTDSITVAPTTSTSLTPNPTSTIMTTSAVMSSSTAPSSSCATSVAPPAPTQTGIVAGCTKWYVAVPGDYCITVASKYDLDVNTFMQWNPAVNYPSCSNMLAGDAYCVATCGGSPSTTLQPSISTVSGTTVTYTSNTVSVSGSSTSGASPTSTSGTVAYVSYTGDGSAAAGWPAESSWIDFDTLFSNNVPQMQAACAQWGVTNDSDEEIAEMKAAIQQVGSESGVDPRVILAVIMQESTGCVRVITTSYSVLNPGLMQSHAGNGFCNSNNAPISADNANVQVPCPQSEIIQMIRDGTEGTSSGDGLEQLFTAQTTAGFSGSQAWYRTVRAYNGGSVAASGDLEDGCCTASYASDIANRLEGWVTGPRTFIG